MSMADLLRKGLAVILQEQLTTGEIPSYRQTSAGQFEYCRSPFVSTFVYDALGHFDRNSPLLEPQTLELIPANVMGWFNSAVAEIRWRIRAFVQWQEESNGTWRFFGSGSGIDPDADTTACSSAVLLESAGANVKHHWQQHVRALKRFRAEEGLYFSYINREQRGYSWMDEHGKPIIGFDRVVNANILRFLGLVGGEVDQLIAYIRREVLAQDFQTGSPDYPNPLCFFYMVARAWKQAHLPGLEQIAASLTGHLLSLQKEAGDFGGPLSTAMALSTLLDLGYTGSALERARLSIIRAARPTDGWGYESFFINGFGSISLTTAISMMALARSWEVGEECNN
jgi:hypothetical protein